MSQPSEHPTIELLPADQQDKPIVQNLGRFYVYEFTGFTGWRCGEDGLYGCRDLSGYWDTGHPYLLRVADELAGFAIVDRAAGDDEIDYYIAEFFVLARFQRRGVGRFAAHTLFDRFPGRWEVAQLPGYQRAIRFWRTVIDEYTQGHFEETLAVTPRYNRREMNLLRFTNASESQPHGSE